MTAYRAYSCGAGIVDDALFYLHKMFIMIIRECLIVFRIVVYSIFQKEPLIMPDQTRRIEIVPYDPAWKTEFLRVKAMLECYLGGLTLAVEHVGSTSVEGLAAKPIIDIDVVMERYGVFPAIVERLAAAGFEHRGDLGIAGREAFKRTFEDGFMAYHLYVCPKDGEELRRHIALRDYLRTHDHARDEYGALKIANAEKFRYDIDGYIAAKSDFIMGILNKTIYKDKI
jgi:GrpB-like predicted nucleotidyltransferase (UPF0157 family)